ncbi:MAG: hypothetical protein FWE07_03100 [Turicibacter sp.]|nr:hypothetical protein [Turicibacter sp.]
MLKRGFAIVVGLFVLTACSRGMSGSSVTTCIDAPSMYRNEETIIIIDGYDEDIQTWTVRSIFTREELIAYVTNGEVLTDDEIADMIDYTNSYLSAGFELVLVSLSQDEAIIEYVYDYTVISAEHLSERWDVEDFEREITLSDAIRGLESQEALCTTE